MRTSNINWSQYIGKAGEQRRQIVRFMKFGMVGALGVVVNLGVYTLLRELAGMGDFISRALAIEISVLHNFAWNFAWTWADRGRSWSLMWIRLLRYHGSTFVASFVVTLAVGWVVLQFLPANHWADYVSHITGIIAGTIANFILSDRLVFTASAPPERKPIIPVENPDKQRTDPRD